MRVQSEHGVRFFRTGSGETRHSKVRHNGVKPAFHDADSPDTPTCLRPTRAISRSYSCGKLNDTPTFSRRFSRGCRCRCRGMRAWGAERGFGVKAIAACRMQCRTVPRAATTGVMTEPLNSQFTPPDVTQLDGRVESRHGGVNRIGDSLRESECIRNNYPVHTARRRRDATRPV